MCKKIVWDTDYLFLLRIWFSAKSSELFMVDFLLLIPYYIQILQYFLGPLRQLLFFTKLSGLFKKIRNIKRTFHARMGMTKERNSKDLTEAEEIKKMGQEYIKLYKKGLNCPNNHNDIVTHLEPDFLEYEVKWALRTIMTNKASRCDWIPAELFKILKDDAIKVLHSVCQKIWKTQQWPQDRKRSVLILIPKKGSVKGYSNYQTIKLISHASKIMLKILQARLHLYMNWELPDAQSGFWRSRGTREQIANIHWVKKKAREFQKNIYFCLIDYAKTFDCVDHNKLWEILEEVGIPDHLTCLLRKLSAGQEVTVGIRHGTKD